MVVEVTDFRGGTCWFYIFYISIHPAWSPAEATALSVWGKIQGGEVGETRTLAIVSRRAMQVAAGTTETQPATVTVQTEVLSPVWAICRGRDTALEPQ